MSGSFDDIPRTESFVEELVVDPDYMSPIEKERLHHQLRVPFDLSMDSGVQYSVIQENTACQNADEVGPDMEKMFSHIYGRPIISLTSTREEPVCPANPPKRVGVCMMGGPASGSDNIIIGFYYALEALLPGEEIEMVGFENGLDGVINNVRRSLNKSRLASYLNMGGSSIVGTSRRVIKRDLSEMKQIGENLKDLDVILFIVSRGWISQCAIIAQNLKDMYGDDAPVAIIVPKTMNGGIRNSFIEIPVGFDTATKIYSEELGNVMKDCLSSKKYYHIVKLMGSTTGHVALECGLQTHPNSVLLKEELTTGVLHRFLKNGELSLENVVSYLCDLAVERYKKKGKKYGIVIIPEGLLSSIPGYDELFQEVKTFFRTIPADVAQKMPFKERKEKFEKYLVDKGKGHMLKLLHYFPDPIMEKLLLPPDPQGRIQVSKFPSEDLLAGKMKEEMLRRRKEDPELAGFSFASVTHFFGYEGRSGLPSEFDSTLGFALGNVAARLCVITDDKGNLFKPTGYIASVTNVNKDVKYWTGHGIPVTHFLRAQRLVEDTDEIKTEYYEITAPHKDVDIQSPSYKALEKYLTSWRLGDDYEQPGPIQFSKMEPPYTVKLDGKHYY